MQLYSLQFVLFIVSVLAVYYLVGKTRLGGGGAVAGFAVRESSILRGMRMAKPGLYSFYSDDNLVVWVLVLAIRASLER